MGEGEERRRGIPTNHLAHILENKVCWERDEIEGTETSNESLLGG